MECPQKGELYQLIDQNGERRGLAIFIEMIAPWTLTKSETMTPGFWHYRVLREGSVQCIDTNSWSLIAAPADLRALSA
jgi:hypothetical protein